MGRTEFLTCNDCERALVEWAHLQRERNGALFHTGLLHAHSFPQARLIATLWKGQTCINNARGRVGLGPECLVSNCDQTEAGIESYHGCKGNLDAPRVGCGGNYVRSGCGGNNYCDPADCVACAPRVK